MRLPIENWIQEKGYTTNVRKLFNESVTCYRNGAYRASLIFSYIGFLTIIKETLIKAKRPSAFAESEWNSIIHNINKDDLWEKEVYEALIRTSKPIFPLNDDLRNQLKYWKDRRNDCAHFKNNEIESHHTESFWSFIKSNVPKMTVEGGMETLLNKFEIHFDETKTPPNADYTNLVKEIENSVLKSELNDFFAKLKMRIDRRRWWNSDSDSMKVYCKILDTSSSTIQEAITDFIKQENRDLRLLDSFPNKIMQLNYNPTEIRNLWKERINANKDICNPFNIYCELLRQNLIPKDEISEANVELFLGFSQTYQYRLPEEKDYIILNENGFFEKVFHIAIESKKLRDYKWVNSKCDLIVLFISIYPLNKTTVECVCKMTESEYPSQWLVRELKNLFSNQIDLKKDFHKIADDNAISIPFDFK